MLFFLCSVLRFVPSFLLNKAHSIIHNRILSYTQIDVAAKLTQSFERFVIQSSGLRTSVSDEDIITREITTA